MGIDSNGVRFLLYARNMGVNFGQTAMIGRQNLNLTKNELQKIFLAFNSPIDEEVANQIFSDHGYAESFFTQFDAKEVHSFDASAYEGATHIHDMNLEIPEEIKGHYSVVVDGGSLEHIFNFPQAIKNCMEMLHIDGHYLGITPGNNFMGHGFYQFSPELFFSVFAKENGFELISLIVFEDRPGAQWYRVKNPKELRVRALLVNDRPVYLLIFAKKIANNGIFKAPPQQSDYEAVWSEGNAITSNSLPRLAFRNWIKMILPANMRHLLQSLIQGYGFNAKYFSPIYPETESIKNRGV